jgi:hypothetical protein
MRKFRPVKFQMPYTRRMREIDFSPEYYSYELFRTTPEDQDILNCPSFQVRTENIVGNLNDALSLVFTHFIISTKLMQILQDFNVNCQFIPSPIYNDKKKFDDYYLVRFKSRISALDNLKSVQISDLRYSEIHLRSDFESAEHAFILEESAYLLVFSEELLAATQSAGITGVVPYSDDGKHLLYDLLRHIVS